jgi:hypothetical protein
VGTGRRGGSWEESGDSAFMRSVRRGLVDVRNCDSGRECWNDS